MKRKEPNLGGGVTSSQCHPKKKVKPVSSYSRPLCTKSRSKNHPRASVAISSLLRRPESHRTSRETRRVANLPVGSDEKGHSHLASQSCMQNLKEVRGEHLLVVLFETLPAGGTRTKRRKHTLPPWNAEAKALRSSEQIKVNESVNCFDTVQKREDLTRKMISVQNPLHGV